MVIYDTGNLYLELTDDGDLTMREGDSEVGAGLDAADLLRLIEAATAALRARVA